MLHAQATHHHQIHHAGVERERGIGLRPGGYPRTATWAKPENGNIEPRSVAFPPAGCTVVLAFLFLLLARLQCWSPLMPGRGIGGT